METTRALDEVPNFSKGLGFLVIFILAFVGISICMSCSKYLYRQLTFVADDEMSQVLIDNDFLDFMPGMNRGDVEEVGMEADRWKCSVCAFRNTMDASTCILCGTANETAEGVGGLPKKSSSYQVFISMLYSTPSAPNNWNARQRSARMRHQWTRHVAANLVNWERNFIQSKRNLAFTIQATQQELPMEGVSIQSIDVNGNVTPNNRFYDTASIEIGGSMLLNGIDMFSTESYELAVLQWTPVSSSDANRTVMGIELPIWKWDALLAVSQVSFSLKYAWFLQQVADLVPPFNVGHLRLSTNRSNILHEALESMLVIQERALCCVSRVDFLGEAGVDAGAVQREWYLLVAEALMKESSGLFILCNRDDQSYFINPNSAHAYSSSKFGKLDHLDAFRAIGRFIGRALLDGQVIPLHLNPVLFKVLLGVPMSLDDIDSLDPTIYKSLQYILENSHVDDLMLTFSVTERRGDGVVEVDLIPNGKQIEVTDANKVQYVDLMVEYLLFGRVKLQLWALLRGVYEIVPPELLLPFDHKELELVLCGLNDIDVNDWRLNTTVSSDLRSSSVVEWFWEVVTSLSKDNQAKLLQYTTGSSRVPVQGFRGLTSYDGMICYFNLKGVPYTHGAYPVIHACYNRIDLPLYPRKELLQEAIYTLLLSDPTGFTIQ
ncbi:hypothetical protein LEN26_005691 [Aphanomyces euteiches]|nr:hypothetical protein AeMF1_000288 [Aphanomyces euteiches]KAH9137546.1 hypothetical protein LEN26_005691 [Aphanomyces euteiches]KAH9196858.1 hypothetical protein AeNC1_001172 [Aphanomyces euteiches]